MATRILPVALLCATLAACGGGGGSDAVPTNSAPQQTCTPVVVHIQMFGDSTAMGVGVFVQSALDAKYGVGNVMLEDRAVGQTWAGKLLTGTDGLNAPWPQSVTAPITTINFGLNDEAYGGLGGPDAYRKNITALAPSLYITPNRTYDLQYRPPELTEQYAQIMREVAVSLHKPVADVNAFTTAYPGWDALLTDGTHPNSTGYDLIAREVIVPALAPLVDPMRCR